MTGMVLAWVSITTGYVVVRATQSLKGLSTGILIYGIWVLVVEVRPLPCPALPCPALPVLCCNTPGMLCERALSASPQVHKQLAQSVMSFSPASRIINHCLSPSLSPFFFSGAGSHNTDAVRRALDGACAQV